MPLPLPRVARHFTKGYDMRSGLVGPIVVGAVIAAAATELIVFRMVSPPDESAALLGGAWLAMPYLVALMLAFLFRNSPVPLTVLLVALALSSTAGISMLANMAVNQKAAEQDVKNAVRPGEDPKSGPAGMRKTGAEVGQTITNLFSVLVAVFVPPVQLAFIVIATLIAWGVSAVAGGGKGLGEEGQSVA